MFLEANILTPIACVILFLLLFPWKPAFINKGIIFVLWNTGIPIGNNKLRVVHVLLLMTLWFFISKIKNYLYVQEVIISPFEGEVLSPDIKVKKYHSQRDLAITLTTLMCWLYVCGFANLMHRVAELKEEASKPARAPQSRLLAAEESKVVA